MLLNGADWVVRPRAKARDVGKGFLYTALASFAIFFMMWLVGFVIFR